MKNWIRHFALLFALFLSLAACKDETPEEHRQRKLNEKKSMMSAYAGAYRGTLTVQGETVPMEVLLTVLESPIDSNDISNTNQVMLQGTVVIYGETRSNVAIQSANLNVTRDSPGASFSGLINVRASDNTSSSLAMSGAIMGSQFDGTINLISRPGYPGTFSLVKGGNISQPISDPSRPAPGANEFFAGSFEQPCRPPSPCDGRGTTRIGVSMAVSQQAPTSEETFLNRFVLQKTVTVALKIKGRLSETSFALAGQMDLASGMMVTKGTVSGDDGVMKLELNCSRRALGEVYGWNCDFSTSRPMNYQFFVSPVRSFQ